MILRLSEWITSTKSNLRYSAVVEITFRHIYPSITAVYLNVELKCSHCFLQNTFPLLLRQLHAVHPAAIQLFEQVGAGHAGESKEGQTLAVFQPHGLLGNPTQDLPSRQVTEVPGVSVGNQEFWVLFTNLEKK